MAREPEATPPGPSPMGGQTRKRVRFDDCPGPVLPGSPVSMVQSLVPHLPGLDPHTLYVISGPFPQYEANSSNGATSTGVTPTGATPTQGNSTASVGSSTPTVLITATPLPAGIAVVARPSGPPPTKGTKGTLTAHFPSVGRPIHTHSNHALNNQTPSTQAHSSTNPNIQTPSQLAASYSTGGGQRLGWCMHWDVSHPCGHSIRLRQPVPPVYYSLPNHDMSGSQSPAMSSEETGSEDGASSHGGDTTCGMPPPIHTHINSQQHHFHSQQQQHQYLQLQQQCQQQYQDCQPLYPVNPFHVINRG